MLTRHRLEQRRDAPAVSTVEAPGSYEATHQSLVRLFRARPDAVAGVGEVIEALLEASDEQLPALLERCDVGFLEGKIRGALNFEDVAWVQIPSDSPGDLVERARARGLEVRLEG